MHVLNIDLTNENAPKRFSASLQQTGFAVLENHPIDCTLIAEIYREWVSFFNHDAKMSYLYKRNTQDGYFPVTTSETAKGASLKDIKEFFQYYPWGQYPQTLSDNTRQLYLQLNELASLLLSWLEADLPKGIAQKLSMPLSAMIENSQQTMLRIIHYPPFSGKEPIGAVRAAAHEDINLITLLVGATQSGLEIKDNNDLWHAVPCDPSSIVVNVGDMLALAVNNYFRSTTHRVINPTTLNEPRLSMPLFLHPRPETPLTPGKKAGQYLQERLIELGVL